MNNNKNFNNKIFFTKERFKPKLISTQVSFSALQMRQRGVPCSLQ